MSENICAICGEHHEELFELDGQVMCGSCAVDNGFVRCHDCEEWVHEDTAIENADGYLICESCYEQDYMTCPDCGEVIHQDDACAVVVDRYGNMDYVCESCRDTDYVFCDHCEQWYRSDRIWASDDHRSICYDCSDYYRVCYDCDTIIPEDDAVYNDDDDEWYCESCYNDRYGRGRIHNYSFKPDPEFKLRSSELKLAEKRNHNPMDTTLMFGIELEVDKGNDPCELASELTAVGMPMYLKHDGSLTSVGIEIVSHPCSLDFHRYDFRWSEISRLCRKHDYTSHKADTCGLHIHVGRRQMGDNDATRTVTAGNLVLLTNTLWDKLVVFSRRKEERLTQWADRPYLPNLCPSVHMTDNELTNEAMRSRHSGRYQAVNLCNNSTVEFRIFRGTLKRDTLIASIQLVSNMTKYAMAHTPTECLNATWQDVVGIEQFKELKAYCEARGL